MQTSLNVLDDSGTKVLELTYSHGDLFDIMRDIVEMAVIGDHIELSFEYDTVNAERCRNFLAIAQLYEYSKRR